MGATYVIKNGVTVTLSTKSSYLTLKDETSYNIYPYFFFTFIKARLQPVAVTNNLKYMHMMC